MYFSFMTSQEAIFDTLVDTSKIYVSMKTNFVLRNYVNQENQSPLYLHITGNSQRVRLNLDINVNPKLWNPKLQRVKEVDKQSKDLNLVIDNLVSKITSIKTVYRLSEMHLTPKKLKKELISNVPRSNFNSFFEIMLKQEKPLMKPGTYRRHNSVLNKLKNYEEDIFFNEINEEWFRKYKIHLKKKGNLSTTIAANITSIKKFLRLAVKSGIKLPIDLDDIKTGSTSGSKTALNPNELKKVFKYFTSEFINEYNKRILGYFLFSCMTALRYTDVMALKREEVKSDDIDFTTIKTTTDQIIKLNNTAKKVIELCPDLFVKKLSNQHINDELKKIMNNIGITKRVTFHCARHTFATNYLRKGGKVEKLRLLLGHSSINQTMVYAHIVAVEANEDVFLLDDIIT